MFNSYQIDLYSSLKLSYFNEISILSPEERKAKASAFNTMVDALAGTLAPAYHLCGIDCGGGKSTLIKDFLRLWKTQGFMPAGSVIICLSRRKEIDAFIQETALSKGDYAVMTNDDRLSSYGLGRERAGEARVLFTTQQMVRAQLKKAGNSFAAIKEFHYRGKPRTCRLWDEAIDPVTDVAVPLDTLTVAVTKMRRIAPAVARAVDNLITVGKSVGIGGTIAIPEPIAGTIDSDFDLRKRANAGLNKEEREAIDSFALLAGSEVGIDQSYEGELSFVGKGSGLPEDMLPIIVFDASIRLRRTYHLQELHRGMVVRLPTITQDYSNLKINLWQTASGKTHLALVEPRTKMLMEAAAITKSAPEEEWLIIHFIKSIRLDIEEGLRSIVGKDVRMKFVHWGDHHGSNAYRHIKRVMVIGLWRKAAPVYKALYMASSGLPFATITDEELSAIRVGEFASDLLQAVCRSNVRNALNGVCGEAEVHMIVGLGEEPRTAVEIAFPGARIAPWEPIEKAPTGQAHAVISYLGSAFSDATITSLPKKDVRAAVGMEDSHSLSQVLKRPDVKAFLDRAKIAMTKFTFIRKEPPV